MSSPAVMASALMVRYGYTRFLQQHPAPCRRPPHVRPPEMPWPRREVLYRHRCLREADLVSEQVRLLSAEVQKGQTGHNTRTDHAQVEHKSSGS